MADGGLPLPRIVIKSTMLPAVALPPTSDSSPSRAPCHKRLLAVQGSLPRSGGEAMHPAPARCAARVLCLTTMLMLSACQPRAAPPTPMASTACGGRFEATVRQGPSAGLSFVGQLVV